MALLSATEPRSSEMDSLCASCRQWSWPLWLPVQFFGIFPDSTLVDNDSSAPWSEELEQKLFSSAVGEPFPYCQQQSTDVAVTFLLYNMAILLGHANCLALIDSGGDPTEEERPAWMSLFSAGIGPYVEMAFFHKPTRTLLTTDAVIFVPQRPPAVRLLLSSWLCHCMKRTEAAKPLRPNVWVCNGGRAVFMCKRILRRL